MIPVGTNLQRNKLPIATLIIIGVNVLFFVVELLLPDEVLIWVIQNFGFGPATRNPLALVTHMFLHGDIYHIAFNMLFLWVFGGPVEERTGTKNFLMYYFGAGLSAGILNVIMEILARPDSTTPGIGASGAISGVMALFLYRCFYSKLKLVISPILLPRQVNIPVIPLVLFWFFQDLVMGIFSLSSPTGVAHWAHIGGFAFGIVIGRIKRYGHEGQIEQLRGKILKKLEDGGGWKAAEKDLLKLLDIAPEDAEVHHDLARLYADSGQPKLAEKHYQSAAQKYFATEPLNAAYTVLEHMNTLSKPMAIQYHLKAADILSGLNELEDAYKALLPISNQINSKSPIMEKGLVSFIKLCQHLNKKEEAYEGIRIFTENFPNSRYRDEVREAMNLKPGEVFTQVKSKPATLSSREEKDADRLGKIEFFERFFADPVFWSILLFVNIATPVLFPGIYSSRLSPVYLFLISFIMTIVHRMGSISDLWFHISGPSEKKARHEINIKRTFDEAVLSEKKAQFSQAAELYEHVLKTDTKNIQARFNLARMYDKRLNDIPNAKLHYKKLTELLPQDHPFHRDASDALKELSSS